MKKDKKKSVISEIEVIKSEKPKEITSMNENELSKHIENIVTLETAKQNANAIFNLTIEHMEIARMYAEGKTDTEIKRKFKDYTNLDLDRLKLNPNFVQEVQRYTNIIGIGSESNRTSILSRVGMMLFEDLINNPDQITDMSARDKIKLLLETAGTIDKSQKGNENLNPKVDITVIMKERGIEYERLKKDNNGSEYIESEYPILDQDGNIIGGSKEYYPKGK
jgi:CRISPR/Cas system CSM-associated protein Csm2 small subunit